MPNFSFIKKRNYDKEGTFVAVTRRCKMAVA